MDKMQSTEASRPDKNRSVIISFTRRDDYRHADIHGGYFPKQPVMVEVAHSGKEIPMFVKMTTDQDPEKLEEVSAQQYFEYWLRLKNAGIPTVPTMRIISENEIIMTDLTADGSHIYGKHTRTGKVSLEDRKLLDIDLDEVKLKCQEIVKAANDAEILLPGDDDAFTLIISPNGEWKIIVLDTTPRFHELLGESTSPELRSDLHEKSVHRFIEILGKIRENVSRL